MTGLATRRLATASELGQGPEPGRDPNSPLRDETCDATRRQGAAPGPGGCSKPPGDKAAGRPGCLPAPVVLAGNITDTQGDRGRSRWLRVLPLLVGARGARARGMAPTAHRGAGVTGRGVGSWRPRLGGTRHNEITRTGSKPMVNHQTQRHDMEWCGKQ